MTGAADSDLFSAALRAMVQEQGPARRPAAWPARNPEQPLRMGRGPAAFTTCTALVLAPQICWDVNGYYRELGIHTAPGFHWAITKKILWKAYQDRDGQSSVRLTYILKQLVDETTRRQYHRAPLGAIFVDLYYIDEMKRLAKQQMAKLLVERGIDAEDEDAVRAAAASVGLEPDEGEPSALDEVPELPPGGGDPFPWSYYLWRSNEFAGHARLAEWQEHLVSAAGEKGVIIQIAVGFCGRIPHSWVLAEVGYLRVVFLNDAEQPTRELAEAAVASLVDDLATTT